MNEKPPSYGPQVPRPIRIKVLRIASLVLAVAGLILLYLYSIHREIPLVRVDRLTPTMNFAYVRIAGTVTRDATLFQSGGVIFNVDDGSGDIAVMGGRSQAEALVNSGRLPRRGDQVEVAGSLSVNAERNIRLRMQSSEQFILQRRRVPAAAPGIRPVRLAEISADREGDRVTVVGVLKDINIPAPGSSAPYVLTLEQAGTELQVVFWDRVFQGLGRTFPAPGKSVRVSGRVDLYQGQVQLKVWEAADLREVDEKETALTDDFPVGSGEKTP